MKDNTKNKTGKFNIKLNYWTGLIIYAVVLLIIGICVYIYTGSCVKKYENSQSDKVMDGFLKDFEKMVDDKTLADNIELPASSEFEGKDTFVNMYMSEFDGVSGYTYKKSEGSYNTEEPQYDIYADDKLAARMTLEAKNQHTQFSLYTEIMVFSTSSARCVETSRKVRSMAEAFLSLRVTVRLPE